jgi:hypothetical protein
MLSCGRLYKNKRFFGHTFCEALIYMDLNI